MDAEEKARADYMAGAGDTQSDLDEHVGRDTGEPTEDKPFLLAGVTIFQMSDGQWGATVVGKMPPQGEDEMLDMINHGSDMLRANLHASVLLQRMQAATVASQKKAVSALVNPLTGRPLS